MKSTVRLCLFGCQAPDRLAHYVQCSAAWQLIHRKLYGEYTVHHPLRTLGLLAASKLGQTRDLLATAIITETLQNCTARPVGQPTSETIAGHVNKRLAGFK